MIELKGSLDSFNSPGETQKRRLQEILDEIDDLGVALIQVNLRKELYRIFFDDQLSILFDGQQRPIEPIINWIRSKMPQ